MTRLLVVLALAACSPKPAPVEPDPVVGTCSTACARLRELSCEEGSDTPEGAPCEEVCTNSGMGAAYDLGCISQLELCNLEACVKP
jgi:hypothetical protein